MGYFANVNLSYGSPLAKFTTGYSNSVNPSAIGQTLQTQSLFANYSYRLNRHLLMDTSGSYTNSQSIGGQSTDNNLTSQFNRSYFTATTGITWELAKNWKLRGSYGYQWQNYKQDNIVQNLNVGTTDANIVMLSLGYTWDGIRTSR